MDFIIRIIANYEQAYVPKLTERFPELAEETPTEAASENKQHVSNIFKQSESELAAHAFFSIGQTLWEGNRREKALSAYDCAIRLKPAFFSAYYNRGNAKEVLGQYESALVDYDFAIRLNPDLPEIYYKQGNIKFHLHQYESALANFDSAIHLNPEYAEAYCHRAAARTLLGHHEEAPC